METATFRRSAGGRIGFALGIVLLCGAIEARAITITYVNPGPLDSRVFVGFANDSSGNTTSDLIIHSSVASRNDTLYGPLPPIGQLPNFDAMTYAAAELGTNLNAPLGTGVRSVFAPLNAGFFQAHGETLAATGFYSSHAYVHSGDTTSTVPTRWIVHVDPSGLEVAGTPADVTINGSLTGQVSVAGASIADASWNVATTSFGTVMSGSVSQTVPGTTPISDSGSLTFTIPLGTTFELLVDYDLTTSGSGTGADSTSEITPSLVEISAVITPPAMFAPVSGTKLLLLDQYAASAKAKMVLLARDPTVGSIAKGMSATPPGLSGTVTLYQLSNPSNRAVFDLAAAGWTANTDKAAKFANATAAPGAGGLKKALIKPDKMIKLLGRNLGDGDAATGDQGAGDLDLSVLTPSDSLIAAVAITNASDSSTHTMCMQFDAPTIKAVAGGTGVKWLSKTASAPASCTP